MTHDPEAQLRRILRERAGTITSAPDYRTEPDAAFRARGPGRIASRTSVRSWQLSTAVLAAAVVVLVTILVLPSHAGRHSPTRAGAPCNLGRSPAFAAALRAGRLAGVNEVLAGAPSGAVLVAPTNGVSMPEVGLAAPHGTVRQMWRERPGGLSLAVANPSSAVDSAVVSFALAKIDAGSGRLSTTTRTVMAAVRSGAAAALPALDPGFAVSSTNPLTAPVVGNGTVTVLEQSTSRSGEQRLVTYASHPWRRVSDDPMSRVTQLLTVGGRLVVVRRASHGVELTSPRATRLPAEVESAARAGHGFASDGATLTWFTQRGDRATVWFWRPDETAPLARALPAGLVPQSASGGVVVGRFDRSIARISVVVPGRSARVVAELPADVSVVRVDARTAVLNTGTAITRVPLRVLTGC